MTPEQRIAELLAGEDAVNWHFAWLLHVGHPEDERHHPVAAVRRQTLQMVAVALLEGYDGGTLAPRPRNATEHRVGERHIGSVLLNEFDRFDGIDWWEVERLLTPMLTTTDRTPPLRRTA